jgi:hypothetical protein
MVDDMVDMGGIDCKCLWSRCSMHIDMVEDGGEAVDGEVGMR